jgi:hypothetical protein
MHKIGTDFYWAVKKSIFLLPDLSGYARCKKLKATAAETNEGTG